MTISDVEFDRFAGLSDDGRAALVAEMVAEYFHPGTGVPWWEMHRKPKPIPTARRSREADRPHAPIEAVA